MELENLDKHVHLTKTARGVEVMFGGQPCLHITEVADGYVWTVNPLFAKLTYGANIFEDVPFCMSVHDGLEMAIAEGLEKLNSLNAFYGLVDLPEDSYVADNVNESEEQLLNAAVQSVKEDCRALAMKFSNNLLEAHDLASGLFDLIVDEINEAKALSGDAYWDAKEKEKKDAADKAERAAMGIKEPVKKGRGKPTNIDLDHVKELALDNIKAGKRPTAGMERNHKIHFVRHLANLPEFEGAHISAAGRPTGTTKAAKAEKETVTKKAAAANPWGGLMR